MAWFILVAIPTIGTQYSMFQAAPTAKMMEDGKIHAVEHIISPIAVQQDPATAAVIPAVSTPPPFQVSVCHGVSGRPFLMPRKHGSFPSCC